MPARVLITLLVLATACASVAGPEVGEAPDLEHPLATDLDIRHVAGNTIYTTSNTGIEDDGLAAGCWLGIRKGDDVPVTYFQIVSNRYTQQENITEFTFAEDMEGTSKWWYYTECQHVSLYPPLPQPAPIEIQWTKLATKSASQFVVTGAGDLPCAVQVTTTLADWQSLPTSRGEGGLLQFIAASNPPPFRAFRIRAGD